MSEVTGVHGLRGPLPQRQAIDVALVAYDAQAQAALTIYADERRRRLISGMYRRGRAEMAALAEGSDFVLDGVDLDLFAWYIATADPADHDAVLARLDIMPEALTRAWAYQRRQLEEPHP